MSACAKGFGVDARERFVTGFSADGEDDGWFGGGEAAVLGRAVVNFKDARMAGGSPDGEAKLGGEEGEEGEGPWDGVGRSSGSGFIHSELLCD